MSGRTSSAGDKPAGTSSEDRRSDSADRTVLEEAQSLIYGDRQTDYGPPTESFESIAGLWSAYITTKLRQFGVIESDVNFSLGAVDVSHMMILMKVSRNTTGGYKRDNPVDIAGYAGCIERIVEDK